MTATMPADRASASESVALPPRRRRRRVGVVAAISAYLITFLVLFPILWIVLLSFQESSKITSDPLSLVTLTLENYAATFTSLPLLQMYANTISLAVVSVTLGTVVSFMISYALARMVFRRKRTQTTFRYYLLAGLAV